MKGTVIPKNNVPNPFLKSGTLIKTEKNQKVNNIYDGKVIFTGTKHKLYGKHVRVLHSNGYKSLYANLSTINVKIGDKLKANDQIGTTGFSPVKSLSYFPSLFFRVTNKKGVVNTKNLFNFNETDQVVEDMKNEQTVNITDASVSKESKNIISNDSNTSNTENNKNIVNQINNTYSNAQVKNAKIKNVNNQVTNESKSSKIDNANVTVSNKNLNVSNATTNINNKSITKRLDELEKSISYLASKINEVNQVPVTEGILGTLGDK
jgi:hypothetical protein